MKKNNFTVKYKQEGKRLSDIISSELSVSKKQVQVWLDNKLVLVNAKRIWMRKHVVKEGDQIEILQNTKLISKNKEISIIWEDDYYLIVKKQPGIITNAAKNSLEERLRYKKNNPNICAVHRLDKETSGCLIFASSLDAKERAIPLFKEKQITKVYRALTIGRFPSSWREIRTDIEGYIAITRVKLLDANHKASYLELQIETGRTHQIRKHLAFKRFPVLGDKKYAGTLNELSVRQPRQMLHAYRLSFSHPYTKKNIKVTAQVPSDFKNLLQNLKLS